MAYNYQKQRPHIFTEQGVRDLITVRGTVSNCIAIAGCVRMDKAISRLTGGAWNMLAIVDYLVEVGELREVFVGQNVTGQHRIFMRPES